MTEDMTPDHMKWREYVATMLDIHYGNTVQAYDVLSALQRLNGGSDSDTTCLRRLLQAWHDRETYALRVFDTGEDRLSDEDFQDVVLTIVHLHDDYEDHEHCGDIELHEQRAEEAAQAEEMS